jgi:formate hydrogenlyase subunit 4
MSVVAQVLQVLFVVFFAPMLKGVMDRVKARAMRRVGPPIVQPYRDLAKTLRKETVRSVTSTGISAWAPVLYFSAPVVVALLIPVLTAFPLPLAFMADMLGGGMILGAAGLVLLLGALDAGSPYTGIGVSRVRLIGTLAEPLTLTVLFTAAAVGGATIPYVVNRAFAERGFWNPGHVLVMAAWFLLILAEAGRLPVDNPDSTQELSLIDPNRVFEASGVDLALLEWGSWMKFTVLGVVLVNVLVSPWGLASTLTPAALAFAIVATAAKLLALGLAVVAVELSFAKLRLMRISEFLTVATAVATVGALAALVLP